MAQFLVDTNLIVDVLRGYKQSADFIDTLPNANISVITWYELIEGVENLDQLRSLNKYLSGFEVIQVSEEISQRTLELMHLFNLPYGLKHDDALIAATCVEYGFTLLTLNLKHFKFIDGLTAVSPY